MKSLGIKDVVLKIGALESKPNQRTQQKQETRLQLMNSAMQLFVELGYEQVTLVQIAEHAQIHVQTLHKHFKTKASLATAYFDFYLNLALQNLLELQPEQNCYNEINRGIKLVLSTIISNKTALPMFKMIHANEELLASTQHRLRLFEDQLGLVFMKQVTPPHNKSSSTQAMFSETEAKMLAAMMVSAYRDAHFSWIRSNGKINSVKKYQEYAGFIEKRFFHF